MKLLFHLAISMVIIGFLFFNECQNPVSLPILPVITVQPVSQTINAGKSVTLNVIATGTEPLSYQWEKDGVNIIGATSNNYSITSVKAGNAGNYTVLVNNSIGSVTSSMAVLSVIDYFLNAQSVSLSYGLFTMIIQIGGTLWACGANDFGQLGDGTTTDEKAFDSIMTNVQYVSAGLGHTLMVKTDASLWVCGRNDVGELGDGTIINKSIPEKIMTSVQSISAGQQHSLYPFGQRILPGWSAGAIFIPLDRYKVSDIFRWIAI